MKPGGYLRSILFGIGFISISQILVTLFGHTIPNQVVGFFREVGGAFILAFVFAFAFMWFIRARPHNKPKKYTVVIFDIFGDQSEIEGLRTEFKTHDVAWSFMKQYKERYPMHNFAMVADLPNTDKKTIFRYI